jgi:hypothetical protein
MQINLTVMIIKEVPDSEDYFVVSCRRKFLGCETVVVPFYVSDRNVPVFIYSSSFPFPFVSLQRRGCLVAPWFL